MPVNVMPTRHFMTGTSTREKVFVAYRTVGRIFACFTVVVIDKVHINTHSTSESMLEIIPASHSTKSTGRAMIRFFICLHPEIANIAMVLSKLYVAINTIVRFR
jgi:acetone carboxylase gamma subunit